MHFEIEPVTEPLMGWGTFADLASPIRALLFGQMIKRAMPVVHEYRSDMYHDALWINANVNGPMKFEWLTRYSGTNIGNSARVAVEIGAPGGVFYIVELACNRERDGQPSGLWTATFTQVPLELVKSGAA